MGTLFLNMVSIGVDSGGGRRGRNTSRRGRRDRPDVDYLGTDHSLSWRDQAEIKSENRRQHKSPWSVGLITNSHLMLRIDPPKKSYPFSLRDAIPYIGIADRYPPTSESKTRIMVDGTLMRHFSSFFYPLFHNGSK